MSHNGQDNPDRGSGKGLIPDDATAAKVLSDDRGAGDSAPADAIDAVDTSVLAEAGDTSAAADDELYAAETHAAADLGDDARVHALTCARALVLEGEGGSVEALALWQSAFERDPGSLIAFWGLRRSLARRGLWAEAASLIEARLRLGGKAAITSAEVRAELWTEHGRLVEDRLDQADEAAQSFRAAIAESSSHPAALLSLLLLGFRREDAAMVQEALRGFVAAGERVPSALRAELAAAVAFIERTGRVPSSDDRPASATAGADTATLRASMDVSEPALDGARAAAALATLREAAAGITPEAALRPILGELAALARATSDVTVRTGAIAQLADRVRNEDPGLSVALLRWQAQLLRDELADPESAMGVLSRALDQFPGHPLVVRELAELFDAAKAEQPLVDLLARVAPAGRAFSTDIEQDLAVRTLVALARAGRFADGIRLLEAHPELPRRRGDVLAAELALRAGMGDVAGLASLFEARAEALPAPQDGAPPADSATVTAHALTVAGALRALAGDAAAGELLWRRALAVSSDQSAAALALERHLWNNARWSELAELWRTEGTGARQAETRLRALENLFALERDVLAQPTEALATLDRILADPELAAMAGDVRSHVRRRDVELRQALAAERPGGTVGPTDIPHGSVTLRHLAESAGNAELRSVLLDEAALALEGVRTDRDTARRLHAEAFAVRPLGLAASALERLADEFRERADTLHAEIAAAEKQERDNLETAGRVRALRYRLAWHAVTAELPETALDALAPLRASGDPLAHAWSWEIARRSEKPALELAVLGTPPAGAAGARLEVSADLGDALERAGDLTAADAAYREALRTTPSMDAALGLLRVAAASGNTDAVFESLRELASLCDDDARPLLEREVALLALSTSGSRKGEPPLEVAEGAVETSDPDEAVLRWIAGTRSKDPRSAARGLIAFAQAIPDTGSVEATTDRHNVLVRAAARARLAGPEVAGAVFDHVVAVSAGTASVGVGLADLPVARHSQRIAARVARAARSGGALAVCLDVERGIDAELAGDMGAALDGYGRALANDPAAIDALAGVKRLARRAGDDLGAAKAAMRLGTVLRDPARASAELADAGRLFEAAGREADAAIACWRALEREPASSMLFRRLERLLRHRDDYLGLERLYGRRLAVVVERAEQVAVLAERATLRLDNLAAREGGIDDLKRILKIDPRHAMALRRLASLAMKMEYFPQAARFLERLIAVETDEGGRLSMARLELADAYEAAGETARAIDALRRAVAAQPTEAAAWQRLTDLHLRLGDWPSAVEALRGWERMTSDAATKGTLWMRIGALLRDHGREPGAAAAAFAQAIRHDVFGDGLMALVDLYEREGNPAGRDEVLQKAIAGLRTDLFSDPLDGRRLRLLVGLCERAATSSDVDPERHAVYQGTVDVCRQLLAFSGEIVELPPPRRGLLRAGLGSVFWQRLFPREATGFVAEIWPVIAGGVAELDEANAPRPPRQGRVVPGSEPRLDWVEAAAVAVGLPTIALYVAPPGDVAEDGVVTLEDRDPGLVLGRGILAGNASARFRVGRALGLLRQRAAVLERVPASELGTLLAGAAVIAGGVAQVAPAALPIVETKARQLAKVMTRREKKALALESSRFEFEKIDASAFREAIFHGADRLGLILAGDVAVAARIAGDLEASPYASALATNERALSLVRFAISEEYLALVRAAATGEGLR